MSIQITLTYFVKGNTYYCTAGIQFVGIGFDRKRKYAIICV